MQNETDKDKLAHHIFFLSYLPLAIGYWLLAINYPLLAMQKDADEN